MEKVIDDTPYRRLWAAVLKNAIVEMEYQGKRGGGAFTVDRNLVVQRINNSDRNILGVAVGSAVGHTLNSGTDAKSGLLRVFAVKLRSRFNTGRGKWHGQIKLQGKFGTRVFVCACVPLSTEKGKSKHFVIAFDDATNLMKKQIDAAWNEVARRLTAAEAAHWIFSEKTNKRSMRWICDMLDLDHRKLQALCMTRKGRRKILGKPEIRE
jgi:hypothetical protein